MERRNIWSLKFSTISLALIPVSVGINYVGKLFASTLKLPLWLDSIGTVLAAILAGPWIGAISGLINNIIYGITMDAVSGIYGITSVAIGLTAGWLAYKGWLENWWKAVGFGIVVALVSTVVSTPINIKFWGGQTGNLWGDALFAALMGNKVPLFLASFFDELVVDLPDKIAVVLISYIIYKALPKRLTILFDDQKTQAL